MGMPEAELNPIGTAISDHYYVDGMELRASQLKAKLLASLSMGQYGRSPHLLLDAGTLRHQKRLEIRPLRTAITQNVDVDADVADQIAASPVGSSRQVRRAD